MSVKIAAMKAIVAECTKLGATVEEFEDYCIIHPPKDNKINDNVKQEKQEIKQLINRELLNIVRKDTSIKSDPVKEEYQGVLQWST